MVAKNPLQDFWPKRGGGRLFDMGSSTVIYGTLFFCLVSQEVTYSPESVYSLRAAFLAVYLFFP